MTFLNCLTKGLAFDNLYYFYFVSFCYHGNSCKSSPFWIHKDIICLEWWRHFQFSKLFLKLLHFRHTGCDFSCSSICGFLGISNSVDLATLGSPWRGLSQKTSFQFLSRSSTRLLGWSPYLYIFQHWPKYTADKSLFVQSLRGKRHIFNIESWNRYHTGPRTQQCVFRLSK